MYQHLDREALERELEVLRRRLLELDVEIRQVEEELQRLKLKRAMLKQEKRRIEKKIQELEHYLKS